MKFFAVILLCASSAFALPQPGGLDAAEQYSYSPTSSGKFLTLAQWQALGYDTHPITP